MEFHLKKRPDKCLVCSLTYGLPQVFSKHPVINVKGIVEQIGQILINKKECKECTGWELGRTQEISDDLHTIPLVLFLNK